MLKIAINPDPEIYIKVTEAVAENGGYCPCAIEKTADTKCPCKEFREQKHSGECHCGRYVKVESED